MSRRWGWAAGNTHLGGMDQIHTCSGSNYGLQDWRELEVGGGFLVEEAGAEIRT